MTKLWNESPAWMAARVDGVKSNPISNKTAIEKYVDRSLRSLASKSDGKIVGLEAKGGLEM